jgi:hypothetical protein
VPRARRRVPFTEQTLPSLWLRLMCLEPLPRPFLFTGQIGWRQVRCDFVSVLRKPFVARPAGSR